MKRNATGFIWGLIIIALGVLIGAKAFGLNFDIFFDGWWTLFIIIPCAVGICEKGNRTGSAIGLAIGVMLLLGAQNRIAWNMIGKLIVACVFVIIGLKLVFDESRRGKHIEDFQNNSNPESSYTYTYDSNNTSNMNTNSYSDSNNSNYNTNFNTNNNANTNSGSQSYNTIHDTNVNAIFSAKNLNYNGLYFGGVAVTAVFGGIEINLRNAVIDKDVIIDVTAIFGGIDIFVPSNVRVVTNCTAIFGGVDNKKDNAFMNTANVPTIYVNGACIFGGVDIK